jgi:hypothetical protein
MDIGQLMMDALMDKPQKNVSNEVTAQQVERYKIKHDIQPGMRVKWKEGLKNKRSPEYGESVLVFDVLDRESMKNDSKTERMLGTPYFGEILDLQLAFTDSDGVFVIFHVDSKRFEPA